jgi:hypothetical protein
MQLKMSIKLFKNHDLRNYIYDQATHNLVTGLGMGVLQNYID